MKETKIFLGSIEKVKDFDHPIVVHINTQKGKGYKLAEENQENWQWTVPYDKETGLPTIDLGTEENNTGITRKNILKKMIQMEPYKTAITKNINMENINSKQRVMVSLLKKNKYGSVIFMFMIRNRISK